MTSCGATSVTITTQKQCIKFDFRCCDECLVSFLNIVSIWMDSGEAVYDDVNVVAMQIQL